MINKGKGWRLATVAAALMMAGSAWATEYSASFKNADIEEFINTVGKNLNKTIIIEPSVRGKINVRSYDLLNEDQYYQFFLSVLDVYGFAVVPMNNGVLKVVRSKDAKTSAIPVVDDSNPGVGDEMVTRVVPVRNVSVRELAPLLRQLNDNAGGGNVVHYEPSNVLLITGRAAVVNRLVEVVRRVDRAGDQEMDVIKLKYASASEMVRLITALTKNDKNAIASVLTPKLVADERTNSVVISGDNQSRQRLVTMIRQLDREQQSQGNTRVFYLKYAKAKNLVDVLSGSSKTIQQDKQGGSTASSNTTNTAGNSAGSGSSAFNGKDLSIVADEQTNALVITAQPDIMQELDKPGRDPRETAKVFEFDRSIRTLNDLREGMILPGIVGNITNFGAFVDLGIKENGLIHLSQMADRYISDPSEVVSIHQHITVKVLSIDKERKRIQLTLKGIE